MWISITNDDKRSWVNTYQIEDLPLLRERIELWPNIQVFKAERINPETLLKKTNES